MPEIPAKSSASLQPSRANSRGGKPLLSIRARLIVLALLAIAPLMVERVRGLERERAERAELARAQVVDLARGGAASQREVISSMRAMLQVVARVFAKMPLESAECSRTLTDLTANVPWIRAAAVAGPNGQIRCATEAGTMGINVGDRAYFQKTMQSRDFSLSDYIVSRANQLPSLIASYPIVRDDGSIGGVVIASMNLRWIGNLAEAAVEHAGTSVTVIDGRGTLLAASADQKEFIGKNLADRALTHELLKDDEGTVTMPGFDGVLRILAYVRVPWTDARLAIGLDESMVHKGIDREMSIAYVQLALFGAMVLLAAWFGGERLILRPIRSLARTAARFGRGDLQARAADEPWLAEFEPLAMAFNDMAHKLAAREEELQIANQHLDELASLDGLTGLANRRGFDRELERAWRRADERRQSLALMMIDIDHFKLFNDRYGHVRGDACLRAVGETLSLVALDEATIVARYGGEEFALLLPGLDLDRALALAEEARGAVEKMHIGHADAPCGVVTISVGVETFVPDETLCADNLVEAADRALYTAKRRGRNMVVAHERILLSSAS